MGDEALAARLRLLPRLRLAEGLPPIRGAFSLDGSGAGGTRHCGSAVVAVAWVVACCCPGASAVCCWCQATRRCLKAVRAAPSETRPAALSSPGVLLPAARPDRLSKESRRWYSILRRRSAFRTQAVIGQQALK